VQATDRSFRDTDSLTPVRHFRKLDKRPFIVRWRELVLSPDGPKSSVARLTLVALSMRMNATGGSCWPSIKTLSGATALSERVVGLHLAEAEEEGWITRERRGVGRYNRGYKYQATVPSAVAS
jgi:hypothetical protein